MRGLIIPPLHKRKTGSIALGDGLGMWPSLHLIPGFPLPSVPPTSPLIALFSHSRPYFLSLFGSGFFIKERPIAPSTFFLLSLSLCYVMSKLTVSLCPPLITTVNPSSNAFLTDPQLHPVSFYLLATAKFCFCFIFFRQVHKYWPYF